MSKQPSIKKYDHPAGGWGSVKAVSSILMQEHVATNGTRILFKQNKPDGFACVSCSWAKPADPHLFEFCENGAKATAWEITTKRATPEFFDHHTLAALEAWSDLELESQGRLTEPMRYDAATDRYLPIPWQQAFDEIGEQLRGFDPKRVVFYASGRASLETSYMYALLARLYGCNNLPDSSNMCHESTSVALPETIGVPVGTVTLEDFQHSDCLFFFGHNTGTNAPRMLHPLQEARKRNAQIITFNPLRERGLVSFANPQSPKEMLSTEATCISTQYHQVKIGGDIAAVTGICKSLIEADDKALAANAPRILDADFIAEHTHGFEAFANAMRAADWKDIELESALTRSALEAAATEYARAKAVMILFGMGITQHREGVLAVQMLTNLMLLRGNIGKKGAGICPIRGHSNVQGQRTVGITEKPALVPMEKLAELYQFQPPTETGLTTVDTCEAVRDGGIDAFIGLGGNFARAIPDQGVLGPGVEETAAHRADRDQAEPQPYRAWARGVFAAVHRAHRGGPAGERRADGHRGGQYGVHSCIEGYGRAGKRTSAVGAGDCRGSREGDSPAESDYRLGRVGGRLRSRAGRYRTNLSRAVHRFQPAHDATGRLSSAACRRPNASGKRRRARRISSCRRVSARIPTCSSMANARCA